MQSLCRCLGCNVGTVCVCTQRENGGKPEGKMYVAVNVFIEWLAIHHRTEYFRCFASSSFGYLCFKERELMLRVLPSTTLPNALNIALSH